MSTKKLITVRDVMKTNFDVVDGKMTVKEALLKNEACRNQITYC